jgi:hypothetical protein
MTTITKRVMLVVALTLFATSTASAQGVRGRFFVVPRGPAFYAPYGNPYWYDPFWWGPHYVHRPGTELQLKVTPKQAEVFVDGYSAGLVSEHGRLAMMPGDHAITFYLEGYRTVTEDIYVQPGRTTKVQETMATLEPGEVSALPPEPAPPIKHD